VKHELNQDAFAQTEAGLFVPRGTLSVAAQQRQPRKMIGNPSTMTPTQIRSIQRHLRRQDLIRQGHKRLHGGIYARWSIELRDDKGRPVPMGKNKRGRDIWIKRGASHSFVQNYGLIIRDILQRLDADPNAKEQLTEDDGSFHLTRVKHPNVSNLTFATGAGVMKFGAGSGARDATDFELQGAIMSSAEGIITFNLVQEVAASSIYEFEGQVTNNTGGLFTVEEMGIYAQLNSNLAVANVTTLIASDLTGSTAVADTLTVLGRYTFTFAV
jgi:hypothetical protein